MRPILAVLSFALLAQFAWGQTSDTPPIRILSPPDGSILTSDYDALIIASLADAFIDAASTVDITFTATKTGGGPVFTIASGNPRSLDGDSQAAAVWDISQVPSGSYVITTKMQDTAGHVYQSTALVTIDHPPVVSVTVVSQKPVAGGVEITFRPTATDPEGDAILSTTWIPGDGSPAGTTHGLDTFTHTYEGLANQTIAYVLNLKVENIQGARGEAERDVVVSAVSAEVRQTNDCGCSQMTIRSAASQTTGVYCASAAPPFQGCSAAGGPGTMGCGRNRTPFTCSIGPLLPVLPPSNNSSTSYMNNLGWRFEVVADLSPGTNAQPDNRGRLTACTEGQVVQQNRTRNGMMIQPSTANSTPTMMPPGVPGNVKTANQTVPPINNRTPPDYGADDYTAPRTGKRHDLPTSVQWIDGPAVGRNFVGSTGLASTVNADMIFVTWVTGNLGTCWCKFEIDHSWALAPGGRTGARTGPAVVSILGGQNCRQTDAPPPSRR